MKMYPREFPSGRRKKPKRQAEHRVYEALASSNRRGFVYYEWRKGYERIELDFAVWVEHLGRFALQVKGGKYVLIDGDWWLKTRDGVQLITSCPLDEAKLAALDLHDDIAERACTTYNPYVIPVVAFTDTNPDPAIESLAKRRGVYVVWGWENLLDNLTEIALSRKVADRLSMERVAREVEAVTDGSIRLAETVEGESHGMSEMSTALSLTVGGLRLIRVSAREMRLRLGPGVGPEAARKRSSSGRP